MSRVEKGSRFFRPVARGGGIRKPAATSSDILKSQNSSSLTCNDPSAKGPALQLIPQDLLIAQSAYLDQGSGTKASPSPSLVQHPSVISNVENQPTTASPTTPLPHSVADSILASKPLFYPESPPSAVANVSRELSITRPLFEKDCNESNTCVQGKDSILPDQGDSQISKPSAAEKMKMKAKAAKAARLFEKSKNSSAGKRSVSVASSLPVSDYESSIASRELLASAELPQDTNLPASADLSLTDGARILSNTKILASNHLEVSVVLEAATLNARALTTRNDILLENPALTGLPQENELRNTTKKYILDGEPSTKISPRLECQKRKRICKKKKNPVECETGTDTSCTNEKLPAKRAKDSTGKKTCASKLKNPSKARKKAPGPRKIGNSLASIDESLERDKEIYESETGLNPGETTMRDLCLPERSRGISSEVLEQRTKLVVERREREKRERFATLQAKKMRNSRPLARSTDSRADEPAHASNNVSFQESRDEENVDSSAVSTETGTQAEPTAVEQTEEDKANHSDSEDNMEDLEEVIFEEFSSLKKRVSNAEASKTAKEPSKSSQQIHNEDEDEDFEEQEYVSEATQYAPQLRVVNGQLVLDQDSLEVNRQDPTNRLEEMEIVEESDSTRLVNSHTWGRATRGERWTPDETSLFYDAVRLFGSDFEMISQLFPSRNRRQIRLKWIKEEKRSPALITDALLGKKTLNGGEIVPDIPELDPDGTGSEIMPAQLNSFEDYAKMVGIDCSKPIPIDPMDKWREKERSQYEDQQNRDEPIVLTQEDQDEGEYAFSDGEIS